MRRSDRQITQTALLRRILDKADTCHLAMVDGVEPYLVTLNFGYSWSGDFPVLYFHSARQGRKIDALRGHPRVCFSLETDQCLVVGERACDWGMNYSSLVGFGTVTFVDQENEIRYGLDQIMAKFAGGNKFDYDGRILKVTQLLKLEVTELAGKQKT